MREDLKKIFDERGVDYYNIDNIDNNDNVENRENIANTFSLGSEADASVDIDPPGQEAAKPESISQIQAPTPQVPGMTNTLRIVSQIFYNTNSTQKNKIKLKMHHTDQEPTEWIASMSTDMRVFRKYMNLDDARAWIALARDQYPASEGFKKFYCGKFHLTRDGHGRTGGVQNEPGCLATMAYNTQDKSWYVTLKIYDFYLQQEYDYNFTNTQKAQGVKAQLVWNNPQLQKHTRPKTYAERNRLK